MKLSQRSLRLAVPLALGACVAPLQGPAGDAEPGLVSQPTHIYAATLQGRWQLVLVVPPGHPLSGTYSGTLYLTEQDGLVYGSVGDWSNGARSRFVGWYRGDQVHLARQDDAPWTGFRASFDGVLAPDGNLLQGTCYNDPSAPHGNNAVCTFTAHRLQEAPPQRPL